MPQQTDLISNFVKLSIRRGSSLTTLSKSPDHLRTVVDAFKATARDPLHPHEDDAKKFLAEAGNWISDTPKNLLEVSASSSNEQIAQFPLSELTSAVEAFREEIRQKRKHQALSREKEVRLSRIDRSRDAHFMREAGLSKQQKHVRPERFRLAPSLSIKKAASSAEDIIALSQVMTQADMLKSLPLKMRLRTLKTTGLITARSM